MSEQSTFDATGIVSTMNPAPMIWPHLAKPKAYKDKKTGSEGKPKFQATFIFDPTHPDLARLKATAVKVARAKWPECSLKAATNAAPLEGIFWPFKNGVDLTTKDDTVKAAVAGKVVLATSSMKQPQLGYRTPEGWHLFASQEEVERNAQTALYGGVYATVEVNFKARDGSKGEKYVTAYVNAITSYRRGDKIGSGGRSLAERFSGSVGVSTAEDPTAGSLDDEIPF